MEVILTEKSLKDRRFAVIIDEAHTSQTGKTARRALARWLSLHPTNVWQKVEFIIEHFRTNVSHLLGGQAKAMVVTSSRAAAVKYMLAFNKYVKDHEYRDVRALIAFSGTVNGKSVDKTLDGEEFTEKSMNPEAKGRDLRKVFEGEEYRVMLVANKFQTGFDQPKLVAMYVDKRVSGVEAVQTLSRLNRTFPGKDRTYVIDFVNEPDLESFAGYARLLKNRLKGMTKEEVDLGDLKMTHFALKRGKDAEPIAAEEGKPLQPYGGNEEKKAQDRRRSFLSELIEKLNELFGEGITEKDKIVFAVHISEKLRENEVVMDQVRNNSREQALRADLPKAASDAIVEALTSHEAIAKGSTKGAKRLNFRRPVVDFVPTR
jgi:type I site-specific restriction-modification system R (restriction) subunit